MATELTEIELTEVSCVKRGANPGAVIMLAKTDDIPLRYQIHKGVRYDTEMSLTDKIQDVGEALQAKFRGPEVYVCVCAVFEDAVIFRLGYGPESELCRASYTHDAATNSVEIGDKVPVKVVYEDAAEPAEKALKGAHKMDPVTQVQPDAISKALADQAAEFAKKLEDAKADFQKQLDSERQRGEAAEKLAKAEQEIRRLNEFVAIGKADYPAVPLAAVRKGEVLKAIADGLPKDIADDVLKVFASANNIAQQLTVATGVYKSASTGSAEDKLNELAKARSEAKGINFYKAYEQVMQENPHLYEETRSQRQ
jgi:predicted RNA-binding protein with RPS1 domain